MELDVVKALYVLAQFCTNQDSCKNCPLKSICTKMPCEWF